MKRHNWKVILVATLLALCLGMLSGCSSAVSHADMAMQAMSGEKVSIPEELVLEDSLALIDELFAHKDSEEEETSKEEKEESSVEAEKEAFTEQAVYLTLTVAPGEYVVDIFKDLVELGFAESVEELIETSESMDRSFMDVYRYPTSEKEEERESHRSFLAEGYIAPGEYSLEEGKSAEEVLKELLSSWDDLLSAEIRQQALDQGYSLSEVLTMASIVEYESSKDPTGEVKPEVSAVIHNRLDYPMGLEMDVTIFYLQEALEPYRSAEDYEAYYDTYETDELPAGPIGSPSIDSVIAALNPADSWALYFVYDREGNYYFSDDYETHLYYVDLYLD